MQISIILTRLDDSRNNYWENVALVFKFIRTDHNFRLTTLFCFLFTKEMQYKYRNSLGLNFNGFSQTG